MSHSSRFTYLALETQNLLFVCVFTAFEQKCGGGQGVLCRPGEAQRLSSLTFGCFQVRGKNPQVLVGPSPSQRTLSTQGETEGRDKAGKSPQIHSYTNRNRVSQDIFWFKKDTGKELDTRRHGFTVENGKGLRHFSH